MENASIAAINCLIKLHFSI